VTSPGHDRNSDSDSAQPLPQARDSASIVAVIQPPEACTKDASRRAERSIEIAAWVVVIFACSQILMFPFGRDQGIFAVIADTILAGGMPYRDAWDVKPPAIFYLYALAQYLVGRRMVAIRIFEVIGLLSLYSVSNNRTRPLPFARSWNFRLGACGACVRWGRLLAHRAGREFRRHDNDLGVGRDGGSCASARQSGCMGSDGLFVRHLFSSQAEPRP